MRAMGRSVGDGVASCTLDLAKAAHISCLLPQAAIGAGSDPSV